MESKDKPTLHLIKGTAITAESIAIMYEKLTGKKATPLDLERCRKILDEADARNAGKQREDSGMADGSPSTVSGSVRASAGSEGTEPCRAP